MAETQYRCQSDGCCAQLDSGICCKHHACGLPNCGRERLDGSSFCAFHKCIGPGCTSQASRFRLCDAHGCRQTGCGAPCLEGRQGCRDHACSAINIEAPICGALRQPRPDGGYYDFCANHRCQWAGCASCRLSTHSWGCDEHTCIFPGVRRCGQLRREATEYCTTHCCSYGDCTAALALPNGGGVAVSDKTTACQNHRCQRPGGNCYRAQRVSPASIYCSYHICQVSTCERYVKDRAGHYCQRHACEWASGNGCDNLSVRDSGVLC